MVMFACQIVVFLGSFFFYPSIDPRYSLNAVGDYVSLGGFLTSSYVELGYLCAAVTIFTLIVIDRLLYLTTNNAMKYFYQIAWAFTFHMLMLFYFKMQATNEGTVRNYILGFLYFIQCIYFSYSAKQIRTGYKERDTHGEFLLRCNMDSNYNLTPSRLTNIGFTVYRAIPFMYETRVVLDWWCIPTSLDIYEWFKVTDIQATLFKNAYLQASYYDRHIGQKQEAWWKAVAGFLSFLVLVGIIWGPLFSFSSGSPVLGSNFISSMQVKLSV